MTNRPTPEIFAVAYLDRCVSVNEMCRRYRVSKTTIKHWARRFGFAARPAGGCRSVTNAPRIILKEHENHCIEQHDGPALGDPNREQIAELSAYCRARRIMDGHNSYVFVQPTPEDLEWVA